MSVRLYAKVSPFYYVRKFSEKTNVSYSLILTHMGSFQREQNITFGGKFCIHTKYMILMAVI